MKSEQAYWFYARDPEAGIGWSGPATWQGWLALALFIAAALGSAAFLVPQHFGAYLIVLGALAMPWLTQYLQFLQEYRFLVFGPILVLLVIFVPHGIVGTYLGWRARQAAQKSEARRAQD